jgi:site-specific recombinase XerC
MTDQEDNKLVEALSALPENPSEEVIDELADRIAENIELSDLTTSDEPIIDALTSFSDLKLKEIDTEDGYETKIEYIREYFETEVDAKSTKDLTAAEVRGYNPWRKYDSLDREEPLADNTLKDDMYLYREFIQYLISNGYIPARMVGQVEIPSVDRQAGEGVDEKKVDPDLVQDILEYLRKYHYASLDHVTWELFASGGPRKSGCEGLDRTDYDKETGRISFVNRDGELKKDDKSERTYALPDIAVEAIEDYIDEQRPNEVDEDGREPLLTAGSGRISKSNLQNIAYQWTRPCKVGRECPHDKDPEKCDAAQRKNWAFKCPSSRAPHHVRTGYITYHRNNGTSKDAIEARCDVSPRTQDIHYDLPDDEEQVARASAEFEEEDADPNSGYQS